MKMLIPALLALAFGATAIDAHARDDDRSRYRDGDRHGRYDDRGDRERSAYRQHDGRRDDRDRRGSAQAFGGVEFAQRTDQRDKHYRGQPRYDDHRGGDRHRNAYRHDDRRYGSGYGYRDDHGYRDRGYRNDGWRRDWRHGWSGTRYRAPTRYYYPSGYAYRSWQVGYYLPRPFLSSGYYVDYRPYGIAPPPYGYRWVRVDGDLLLVEIASTLIADILHGFYR